MSKERTEENLRSVLRGIVARGWCDAKNKHRVLDPDLVEAIVEELIKSNEILLALDEEYAKMLGKI